MNQTDINILVIDDDPTLLNTIKLYLGNLGYRVQTASNGSEALGFAGGTVFDIVLCDYNLPDIMGLELIKQILKISRSSVPILITGTRSMELALEGMRMGVHDYLVKPIDYEELKKVIGEIIEERSKFEKGKEKLKEVMGEAPEPAPEQEEPAPGGEAGEETLSKEAEETGDTEEAPPAEEVSGDIPALEKEEPPVPVQDIPQPAPVTPPPPRPQVRAEYVPDPQSYGTEDKERTIFDFVLDKSREIKKNIRNIMIISFILALGFVSSDTVFLQITPLGKQLHNMIWPPSLILDSIPTGARVTLKDDRGVEQIGANQTTPVTIPKILPGGYMLYMELRGYNNITRKITIYGERKKVSNVSIAGDARNMSSEKTQKFVIPFEMPVTIESDPPGAVVYIDDKRMGNETPLTVDLTADIHTVTLQKEGFESLGGSDIIETPGQCRIDLTRKDQEKVDFRYWEVNATDRGMFLKGKFWKKVDIMSSPEGAQLFVDGEMLGVTPLKVKLTVGEHTVQMKKAGFTDYNGTVKVPEQEKLVAELLNIVRFLSYNEEKPGSDVGAQVWIEGTSVKGKKTPFQHAMKPGVYNVVFRHPTDYMPWEKKVTVRDQNQVIAYMKPGEFDVEIKVTDAGTGNPVISADIRLNGDSAGSTDADGTWRGRVKLGTYRIDVSKEAFYEPGDLQKDINADNRKIDVVLSPIKIQTEDKGEDKQKKERESKKESRKEGVQEKEEILIETLQEAVPEPETSAPEMPAVEKVLIIDTRPNFPGASIYVDGKFEGETIRRITGISQGYHKITIKHPYIGESTTQVLIDNEKEKIIINYNNAGEVILK
ncbi:MAG: PEGA domain-containing protein [Elusimicrobia bacterium]|nr:PEGA domain-containing protein [Elusimicrobiota bacterium]